MAEEQIIVCVQLLGNPDSDALNSLDTFMSTRGYVKTVKGSDGTAHPLPQGSYSGVTDGTLRDAAVALAVVIRANLWNKGSIVLGLDSAEWGLAVDDSPGGKSVKEASKEEGTRNK